MFYYLSSAASAREPQANLAVGNSAQRLHAQEAAALAQVVSVGGVSEI